MARRRRRYRPVDPLAPLSEQQIRRRALRDVALAQKPLASLINQRATAGARNIEGVYSNLAGSLAGYQQSQQDIYGRARTALEGYQQQGQQALGQAQSAIGAQNANMAALSGATVGVPAADQQRIVGGTAARGTAELGELALRQAAAENYAALLPGIARLSGAQGVQALQAQRARDIAELTARGQSSLTDVLGRYRQREYEKAVARLGYQGDILGIQAQNQRTQYTQQQANWRTRQTVRVRNAAITAANKRAGMSLAERARHNGISEQQQAARDVETRRKNRAAERQARINQRNAERQRRWARKHPKAGGGAGPYPGAP